MAKVFYFPVRGAGEVIRLTLAAANVEFENEMLTWGSKEMKENLDVYAFGQSPRYCDDDIDLVQTIAILRYLGRRHGLYSADAAIAARTDQLLYGMADLKVKISPLVYVALSGAPETEAMREEYVATRMEAASAAGQCGGAHLALVDRFVQKHGKNGYAVGDQLSIADIYLFDLLDLHRRKFGGRVDALFPALAAHSARIAALPGVAAYLASDKRMAQ